MDKRFGTLLLALACIGCRSPQVGLVDGRLNPCASGGNCVSSEPAQGKGHIEPLSFPGAPRESFDHLADYLAEQKRVLFVRREPDYIHTVFISPHLRFRDDVEFRLDAPGRRIHVRSASRVGFYDFGANRRRIEAIRNSWEPPARPQAPPSGESGDP